MIGSFLTSALALVLGYAYPAYECFKFVELNKPEIEQLRFWCQYWLPMYSETKVALFVYLWYPKTRGTAYVYETFFRPYVSKHETEIDHNLLELRTWTWDMVVLYSQRIASYGQTRFFEILQYVASQSQSQPSRPRPPQQARQTMPTTVARHPAVSPQLQQIVRPPPPPASPTKSQVQESTQAGTAPSSVVAPPPTAAQSESSGNTTSLPASSETVSSSTPPSEAEAMQVEVANATSNKDSNPPAPQERPMEETIRGRLRKRAATAGPETR